MKMTVVITMAGLGSRFRKAGYKMPKYQIEAHGRTLFDWSMESLKGFADPENDYIFVVRKEDDAEEFIRSSCEKIGITNVTVIGIDYLTDGQATTAMLAKDVWDKESALMIYNIDTYVEAYEMKTEQIDGDGFIPCFHAPGDHWSFAKLDANGKVVEVREKNVFPTTVHSVLIISRPVHCTNSFITNTIPAKKSWKRVKNMSHRFTIT